jgi:hypothetical protein
VRADVDVEDEAAVVVLEGNLVQRARGSRLCSLDRLLLGDPRLR